MRPAGIKPSGIERRFPDDDIIVSKTNAKGIITYANALFCKVAGYTESELVGQAHNIVRHPDMPRCVFKLLWDTIQSGQEIFAYVLNMSKNGDHYWVYAHVTPTFDSRGNILGYHSSRRSPDRRPLDSVKELYKALLAEERKAADWRAGMNTASQILFQQLEKSGMKYEEWIYSL